jgi:tripartite-type tricarboxylate transporter receptor subunit TctC
LFPNLRPSAARALATVVVPVGWLVFGVAPGAVQTAPATSYPNRPGRFVVPFPSARNTDAVARTSGQKLAEMWGQQLVIDDRGGANTSLGAEIAARAPADGYTVFLTTPTTMAIDPSFYRKLPYDPVRDFTLIAPVIARRSWQRNRAPGMTRRVPLARTLRQVG